MYAVVRELTFTPGKADPGNPQIQEFARLRAQQPGYQGRVAVDAGNGRVVLVALWESQERAEAAARVLDPEAQRLLNPMFAAPMRVLAAGNVLSSDVAKR